MILKCGDEGSDGFSVLLKELLLGLCVAYLAIEEDVEDVVEFCLDHLVVEDVGEMGRAEYHLL